VRGEGGGREEADAGAAAVGAAVDTVGVRGVAHGAEREREVDGGVRHRPCAGAHGEAVLCVGWGQRAARAVQGLGVRGEGLEVVMRV
jgi:hypothetical protein